MAEKLTTGRVEVDRYSFSKLNLLFFVLVFAAIGGYFLWKSFAATAVAKIEAEQMSLPSGANIISDATASGGQAVRFTSNGTASGVVSLPSTAGSLSVAAHGNKCRGDWAKFDLSIDGTNVLSATASKNNWISYSVVRTISTGNHTVAVSFNNAQTYSNCSRNLYLDAITFYGQDAATPATSEINVLTEYGTTDSAIRAAISAAMSQNKDLYFPAATYNYNNTLTLDGLKARGDGEPSVLVASNKPSMAIIMKGSAPELRSLKIACPSCELPSGPPTSARLSTGESAGVFIQPGTTNFVIDRVTIDRAGSAGILNWGGNNGVITNNRVLNTLADAYHMTNGAYNVEVAYNYAYNVGDDMYAVVSYLNDGQRSHDIKIHDNVGDGQPWGRGASVVGGYNIQIYNNSISRTYGAGIYIEAEGISYGNSNITLNNNTVRYPDQAGIHGCNILVGTYQTSQTTTDVTGSGNNLDRTKLGLRTEGNYSGVSVGWFYGN